MLNTIKCTIAAASRGINDLQHNTHEPDERLISIVWLQLKASHTRALTLTYTQFLNGVKMAKTTKTNPGSTSGLASVLLLLQPLLALLLVSTLQVFFYFTIIRRLRSQQIFCIELERFVLRFM